MMNVAVTGATGFLGRYVVNELLGRGHACRCWYRPDSDRGGFVDAPGRLEWRLGRLGDDAATRELVADMDAIVHSALAHVTSESAPFDIAQINITGSMRLMQAAHAADVGRFVQISTCAVHERIMDDRPLDEAHPLWPASHYGAHKAALEKFVHSFGFGLGWPICALRPTGIYGPRRPFEQSRWYDLVRQVVAGEAIDTPTGGKEVHAADVAKAVAILLEADPTRITGEAFNCCDMYIATEHVAEVAQRLSGGADAITRRNQPPKHQIDTTKIQALGMRFGGEPLLREYVAQLVEAVSRAR